MVGESRFIPGFVEGLAGAKAGEERAVNVKFPDDYPEQKLAGRAPNPGELVTGAEVLVAKLGGRGVIVVPPRGGRVVVQAGAMRLTLDEAEVLMPTGHAPPAPGGRGPKHSFASSAPSPAPAFVPSRAVAVTVAAAVAKVGPDGVPVGPATVRTPGNTVDLRGERADAAVALAETFLDDALQSGQDAIYLLHGHGTGALRGALRDHFARYPGIASMRPGGDTEGGEGVTVLELR